MIAFVKEAEALLEKGQLDRLKNEEGELTLGGVGGARLCGGEVLRETVVFSVIRIKER